jgi:acyl-CoA oxidase
MDNGFLILDDVRIPRENMAMRFQTLSRSGELKKLGSKDDASSKISYITMMLVRAQIVYMSSQNLGLAVTIATRYSAVRLQGFKAGTGEEVQILDYVMQQHRLFTMISSSYCFFFTGERVLSRLFSIQSAMASSAGTVSKAEMADIHCSLSALKSFCSTVTAAGIEDCRRACGGHGYLDSSGLPELVNT